MSPKVTIMYYELKERHQWRPVGDKWLRFCIPYFSAFRISKFGWLEVPCDSTRS